jgi:hypothetical protein
MSEPQPLAQSDQAIRVGLDAAGGCCWEICAGGECLQGRDRVELLRRAQEKSHAQPEAPPSTVHLGLRLAKE